VSRLFVLNTNKRKKTLPRACPFLFNGSSSVRTQTEGGRNDRNWR
jgi:hypothetical protein